MVLKIILFLTVFGLQNIDGKAVSKGDHPKDHGIIVDFSVGSLDVQPRDKRNTFDSQLPKNARSQTESLRKYLHTIERYMPAIKANVEKIERQFAGYNPFEDHNGRFDNGPNHSYENDFAKGGQDIVVETPWTYNPEHDFYSLAENGDDSGRINNYEEGGVNQTLVPDFAQLPRPETDWQIVKDERIDPLGGLEKFEHTVTENSDVTSSINSNYMNPVAVPSNREFFNVDVKEIKHHGMTNLCDECGKPIHSYDYGHGSVKPLVININSDCIPHSNDRFTNKFAFQSRGHSRPIKFHQTHHHIPKYCHSFHYREMPRHPCM